VGRYDFWITDTHAVQWHLDKPPAPGDIVDFGAGYLDRESGRYRVVELRLDIPAHGVDASFQCQYAPDAEGRPINVPQD